MNKNIKRMVFIAIYVALALVLDYIKEMLTFLDLPQGGSVNIALIPIVFASFHLGYKEGMISGLLWWAISSLMGLNAWMINPIQYCLDYIIPSSIVGLASIFNKRDNSYIKSFIGIIFVMIIRTMSIILSGVYYWADGVAAGSKAAWIASLSYNLPYSIMTCAMLLIIIPLLLKLFENRMKRFDV